MNISARTGDPDGRRLQYKKEVSDEFKTRFSESSKFMAEKGTKDILNAINNDKTGTVYLAESKNKTYYDPNTNTLYWNPNLGVYTTEGIVMSPTTVLNHEFDHALQDLQHPEELITDLKTKVDNYGNAEDKRVIEGSEQVTAKKHGDIPENGVTRKDHKGTFVVTESPTSPKLKIEITVTPENNDNKRENQSNNN